jgi:hypothetical protein
MQNRSWHYVDRYMLMQIAREHRLKPVESYVLFQVTMLADYREKTWTGNAGDLCHEIHASWRAANAAIGNLISEGLFVEEVKFGRNRNGRVRIAVFDQLILMDKEARDAGPQPYSRESAGITLPRDEPDSRAIPAVIPRNSRESADITSQNVDLLGIAVKGDGGGEMCLQCHQPTDGRHPFTHDPVFDHLNSPLTDEFDDVEVPL